MDSGGNIREIPTKTEDLTASKNPDTPDQTSQGGTSGNTSGSGGENISTYAVTVEKSEHGKVTSNRSNASGNSAVTLTVTPDSGYVLDTLTVTDSRGNKIRLAAQGGGKYIFTMPSSAVTVKATFAPLPDDTQKPCDGGVDCPSRNFTDLGSVGTWYHEAVDYVLRNGLMGGYGNGLFGPDNHLSRAQLAQILYNRGGKSAVTGGNTFTDVAPGTWYAPAITWAAERGIVGGYGNGTFGPSDNITREQLAVMLWRYSGSPAATQKELHFNDADEISGYALEALCWAVENGILNGYGDGRLGPQGQTTRAQVAQMLLNYLER
ncbi:S-layer homology domain-containing protein [Oscillibacter sp. CU971]|uniref:S-layer homology domain-containing protein n=1 Tax=Oscillibacter sp. CU971 TaxID=2780102 RepID=UPI00195968B9|nr:S-layer homology domain-containing protein [Oscillibacter sp. CU971]